jgi:hypothetical protein
LFFEVDGIAANGFEFIQHDFICDFCAAEKARLFDDK